MARGKFITFEGGEGVGKSTQARLAAERLERQGIATVLTREPGGTPFAEEVRDLLLGASHAPRGPLAEALLFYAARSDHLDRVIRPALAAGRWVVSDRFSDSTRVYQNLAGGLTDEAFATLERLVVAPTAPDLTLVLDIPPEEGLRRAALRRVADTGADRFEARTLDFHRQLREGFLAVAAAEPERCVVIDAAGAEAGVAARVWAVLEARLLAGSA